jgi:sensor c-di-GMP phosphodiesterase-like protein
METIINARKTVRNYIIFNLTAGAVFLLTIYTFVMKETLAIIALEQHKEITTSFYAGAIVALIIVTTVFIGLFWLFYRLIYGFLLTRLKKNYKELEKIDY